MTPRLPRSICCLACIARLAGLAAVLLSLTPTLSHAQESAAVRGFVTAEDDGQPLQGVHVVLTLDDTVLGSVTDPDGIYLIGRVPPGRHILQASFIGFETFSDTLDLAPGDSRQLDIALVTQQAAMDEVVVEAERETGAARVTAGQQRVLPQDIELIPSPSVSGDLVNYLAAQPGVVSMGDRGGQVFIRGGEPTQNLTMLDGMYILQPFHLLGFYSAFPSDIINNADIYAGGFGAEFSGRLSSVIDVQTRNGNKRRHEAGLAFTPFVNSARLEGPLVGNISFLGSARISTLEEVASLYVADDLPYRFGDVFGKIHIPISRNHQTSISSVHTFDRGTLAEPTLFAGNNEIRWKNTALGVRHLVLPRSLPILGEALFSWSRLQSEYGPSEEPTRTTSVDNYNLEVNFSNFGQRAETRWGFFARNVELSADLGGTYQNIVDNYVRSLNAGGWAEPEFDLGNGLRVRLGAVGQFFGNSGFFVEPRFRAVLERGRHQWSMAGGMYRQNILGLSDRRDAASIFTAYAEAPTGEVPAAVHGIVGYRITPSASLEISVEAFYKDLSSLYIAEWTSFPRFTTRLQPADGEVLGMDLRMEFRRPNFYAFLNYGYSSTTYDAMQESLPVWFGTDRLSFRPPHDRRHQLNLILSGSVSGFDMSARWNIGSGLPYTEVRGFDGFILMDGVVDVEGIEGFPRVIYDRPYEGVLPMYHRLDVTIGRDMALGPADLTVQAGAINVYNRANLFALDIFTLQRTDQLPFVPTVGIEIEF